MKFIISIFIARWRCIHHFGKHSNFFFFFCKQEKKNIREFQFPKTTIETILHYDRDEQIGWYFGEEKSTRIK